jgi:hypothetical protein
MRGPADPNGYYAHMLVGAILFVREIRCGKGHCRCLNS